MFMSWSLRNGMIASMQLQGTCARDLSICNSMLQREISHSTRRGEERTTLDALAASQLLDMGCEHHYQFDPGLSPVLVLIPS